ncbi:MAG: S8 family serine peptidase, partial [Gemmatimonadales bacterium]|nr:S8 family serine peptidase [Gemmatimonadales bacterium]
PGVFAEPPRAGQPPAPDVLGWWSARGGEVAKPDACAPGVAYSNVPAWRTGEEVSGGTSMAAPQVAGAAALLQSGLRQLGSTARAIDLKRSLVNTARPLGGTTILDEGLGVIDVPAAFQWLRASHQTGVYEILALPSGGNQSRASAAYRRGGLASPDDTVQAFVITSIGGQPAARLILEPDVPWLHGPALIEPGGAPVSVQLTYDAAAFTEPGLYNGTMWARPATDALAGASFGLTNTIIVPHTLHSPIARNGMLTPGAAARYFLEVPDGSAGLRVAIDLNDRAGEATLYLFEPDGRPHRGGSSVIAADGDRTAEMIVSVEDLLPGVYEAVVVAPPTKSVAFRFSASVPALRVRRDAGQPALTIENPSAPAVTATAAADVVGVRSEHRVEATRGRPGLVSVVVPDSAGTLALETSMSGDLWRRLTDFGVTVFDRRGRKLSDGPLHYPLGRQALSLSSAVPGDTLVIELLPAFADTADTGEWEARLRVDFLLRIPVALTVSEPGSDRLHLAAGQRERLVFAVPADSIPRPVPAGALVAYRLEMS